LYVVIHFCDSTCGIFETMQLYASFFLSLIYIFVAVGDQSIEKARVGIPPTICSRHICVSV